MATLTIRERVQAANTRVRGLRRADRVAAVVITLGGLGIVASVLGILVVIAAEALPLFGAPEGRKVDTLALGAAPVAGATPPAAGDAPGTAAPLALGADEYQRYLYAVRADARITVHSLGDGALSRVFELSGVSGAGVTSASRSLEGDFVAAGTSDGRVALAQVTFSPRYENQQLADLDIELKPRGTIALDPGRRPVRMVDYKEDDSGNRTVAAVVGDEVLLWSGGPYSDEASAAEGTTADAEDDAAASQERRHTLRVGAGEGVTAVALGINGDLVAGTDRGSVHHWMASADPPRLLNVSPVGQGPVTALGWILGDISFVACTREGRVSAWFAARVREEDEETAMVRAHTFAPQGSAVTAFAASSRDKSFVTVGADGSVLLRYLTNERTLLALKGPSRAASVLITPKGDGVVVGNTDGTVTRFAVSVPYPEVTWRALFGKLWYEGYGKPEYVWQSTGGTNDFETKFSLVPLIFGTLKGTFYALLFAIPLAVLGALYTSQFVHPAVRAKIKPTVEVMAALPSVVIGFVAGLYLAPLVERVVVPVLLMMVLLPLLGTSGVFLWSRLPVPFTRRLKPGMELFLIVPLLVAAAALALGLGPRVEAAFFQGDFRLWLSAMGVTYDQRNSLVVGLAMGFAVIPIIFTIADDALSSVPSSLTAGSLALGASRWQTALRVVLPTASPGIFSAVMIGFGRAVGETMIVLMATGNTPVLDWSMFNGMRTLSANIAVEIPEAPHGGTLYRVLFLAAGLLFMMTFAVNTVAELVRQRLRERYRAL
jgi:phosphate transport system permease protein